MTDQLRKFRYYLEIISVPIFAWLVIHLAGHGAMLLKEGKHEHEEHGHDEHAHEVGLDLDFLLSTEVLAGLIALILFAWIWHRPAMKKLVPCSHDHCHHTAIWPHILASGAFVFHFFPESQIRYEILHDFDWSSVLNMVGAFGFLSHFAIDLILIFMLSQFWKKSWQRWTSGLLMLGVWALAFWVGERGGLHIEGIGEPIILIVSAFLLAMFVHKPEKPTLNCHDCCED